jgi:hypothetical protein
MMFAQVLRVAAIWMAGSTLAHAFETIVHPRDEPRWRPDGTFVQVGGGHSNDSWIMGAQWDWHRRWELGASWLLSGQWNLSAGRMRALDNWKNDNDSWYTKIGFMPSVRIINQRIDRCYLELGTGPVIVTPVYISRERTFSTVFNFENRIAAGVQLGQRRQHDFSVSFDHISNADIEQPNPGLNQYSVRYTLRF